MKRPLAIVVFFLGFGAGAVQAQVSTDISVGTFGARPVTWRELVAFHDELAAQSAAVAELADARAYVAKVFAENRDFRNLSGAEQKGLVEAHNRIVAGLDLPSDRELRCAKEAEPGSHLTQVRCFLARETEADRERMRRLTTMKKQTG
ncbi:MAG TPA: hypothetical protein VFO79_03785 [Xanthomonadales bacterium]|nr:hypothetical protein [Xanthomonadales bacterium]